MKNESKTLKDFIEGGATTDEMFLDSENLKREAVKWVKKIRFIDKFEVREFMRFFNLTEEDLRDYPPTQKSMDREE